MAGTEKENAAGADVPGDQSDGKVFRAAGNGAKTKWEAKRSSWIFALFGEHPDGMGGYAGEAAHGIDRL